MRSLLERYHRWRREHFPASKADLAWRHEALAARLARLEASTLSRLDAMERLLKQNPADRQQVRRADGDPVDRHVDLPLKLEIIVAVCNAGRWLETICDGYADLNLNPLFVVDSRSSDRSLDILAARGHRVTAARGDHPRVESLLFALMPRLKNQWILRFDDDELPSRALIDWVGANLSRLEAPAVSFPRHWVAPAPFSPGWVKSQAWDLDRQFRLFATERVKPTERIHTPGFEVGASIAAPAPACIYHFDWIVRGPDERLRKVQAYDGQGEGAGSAFREFYLPEEFDPNFYNLSPLDDPLIESLVSRLAKPGLNIPGFWKPRTKAMAAPAISMAPCRSTDA